MRGDVGPCEHHFRVSGKGLAHVLFVVLAGNCEQNSGAMLLLQKLLKRDAACVDPDTLRPIFATDAVP